MPEYREISRVNSLWIWFFLRLLLPTTPILIQYGLKYLNLYEPEFPQITYIILLFTLALVTITEHSDLSRIIWLSVVPTIVATFLLTAAFLSNVEGKEIAHTKTLTLGFYFWLLLLIISIGRIILDFRQSRTTTARTTKMQEQKMTPTDG